MATLADQIPAFKSPWSFIVERENADFDKTIRDAMSVPVERIATKEVVCVDASDDLGMVARILSDRHLKKAPVVRGDLMVGIINRSDISKYAVRRFLGEDNRA